MIAASVSLVLVVVLVVHIYMVTRPSREQMAQRVMARIDFKQDIAQTDADKITAWLYAQAGVDHVLCNAESDIAVFTFSPAKNNADKIINELKTNYKAERYMPAASDMRAGCPVAMGSWSDKLYSLIKGS